MQNPNCHEIPMADDECCARLECGGSDADGKAADEVLLMPTSDVKLEQNKNIVESSMNGKLFFTKL